MSWTNELYKVYELASKSGTEDTEKNILPLSHSTANAQIEIVIGQDGEFLEAAAVSKNNAVTVIPVTEASGTRSSGIAPMPLADKLVYIAGDYSTYSCGKRADNSEYFSAYMSQLKEWCDSEFSVPAVKAIYAYLEKGELIQDLVGYGILEIDESTGKLSEKKLDPTTAQPDAFVRFIVSSERGLCLTWKDTEIHDSFIRFNTRRMAGSDLCYATGKTGAITYKHPAKIRNSGDKAKLISSNDESGFTYRGRFNTKEEAVSIGYDYSQKIHNALKWLIRRQGKSYDSLTLITWNSALDFVPSVVQSAFELFSDKEDEYSSIPEFSELINKKLMGGKADIDFGNKVMIMGLDAATTGRLSISVYTEMAESQFYDNLRKWHEDTRWSRFHGKLKKNIEDSCSLPAVANCLYGTEQAGNKLECDKKMMKELILRLVPCVAEGRRIPRDIVQTLYNKASHPLSYEFEYNHRIVLENACALIRKEHIDYNKGEIKMAYDPNCTDRSYLYGCLLAIADKAESDTYERDEKRVTNARRLWSAFAARPCQTWQIIEERLEPYLEKEQWAMTKYTKLINEIMSKLSPEDYADNSKLSPLYLIGYHHYNALLWTGKEDKNEED